MTVMEVLVDEVRTDTPQKKSKSRRSKKANNTPGITVFSKDGKTVLSVITSEEGAFYAPRFIKQCGRGFEVEQIELPEKQLAIVLTDTNSERTEYQCNAMSEVYGSSAKRLGLFR